MTTGPLPDKPRPWSAEQYQLLLRLGAAPNADWDAIAGECGHSKGSCHTTLNRLLAEIAQGAGVAFGKTDPRNPKRYWTAAEQAELWRLRTVEKQTFPAIDKLLGRTLGCSAQKFSGLRRDPVAANGIELRAIHAPKKVPEHTSLTAAQLGDPLPGRSALDRLRAGIAEPKPYLGHAARYPMRVSLAGS